MATTTVTPQAETYRRSWVIDWLTTVDHKKIGILYILNSFFFFFAAGILALCLLGMLMFGFADDSLRQNFAGTRGLLPAFACILSVHECRAAPDGKDPGWRASLL